LIDWYDTSSFHNGQVYFWKMEIQLV